MSIFIKIEKTHVKSNTFDLSHDRKFSTGMGRLTPVFLTDLVPGDKITVKSSAMVRFAPLVAPVMHLINVYVHYFFVPNRLLWPNWEKFITGGEDGLDNTVWPYFSKDKFDINNADLHDYLGMPILSVDEQQFSAMPAMAYWRIWYDYYRDQNLQQADDEILNDGSNNARWFKLKNLKLRAWQHDYFTSALPFTQKGPAAMVPIAGQAPVIAKPFGDIENNQTARKYVDGTVQTGADLGTATGVGIDGHIQDTTSGNRVYIDLEESHYADLTAATAGATIDTLRRAFKLQEWLEKNARGGSRYIESIAVHFGVQSSDQRLQRPKFLGGFKAPIKVSEVVQTAPPTEDAQGDTPLATMSGHAIGMGGGQHISHYAEEHGYIMGIMSVMPKTAYFQGIPKHFLRKDRFDYYWPEFAHIGEQAIENKELYAQHSDPDGVFGYTPRYAEYKFINSSVHGDMRGSLDFWHLGRRFASEPALNEDFITVGNDEVKRIFAVDDNQHLWCHILNDVKANRKMPVFGTPSF